MCENKWKTLAAALLMTAAGTLAAPANATLMGNTVTATGTGLGPSAAVVAAGAEFTGIAGAINFDFGANTLTLTRILNGGPLSWTGWGNYTFSGFTDVITGFSVNPLLSQQFSGSPLSDFSFGAHSLTINFDAFGTQNKNSILVYNIATTSAITATPIPEPATTAIFGLGLLGIAIARKRKNLG